MKLKFIRLTLALAITAIALPAGAANYCLAIRGNGELEPAHWGAAAGVIERLGLPQAQAGGSSATITMLLIDAMATNPLVQATPSADQGTTAALMLKSLEGLMSEITDTTQWRDFLLIYKGVNELKKTAQASQLNTLLSQASNLSLPGARAQVAAGSDLIRRSLMTATQLGLVSETSYAPLFRAIENLKDPKLGKSAFLSNLATAKFYAGELSNAVSTFGAFNAQTDANLFFRPGLVDFDRLADQFGRIADFYSMQNADAAEVKLWNAFVSDCAVASRGQSWGQLVATRPSCASGFHALVQLHFNNGVNGNFARQAIGVTIPSFGSIAVLTESAHDEAVRAATLYRQNQDPQFGANFSLSAPDQVRFGYWGREELLKRIAPNLSPADEKSRRFLSLGRAPWKTVLGLSPAEPGLSPLKEFTLAGQALTSAGGWSDLNPSLVLRAVGCENVVYITRRGGESLFGQGVAKRLLGLDLDWSLISSASDVQKKASARRNNNGDPSDLTSLWSRLYNLANPASSLRRSLDQDDAVLCTNWDAHEITEGVGPMIQDAYSAKYYVAPNGGLRDQGLQPQLNPKDVNLDGGYPSFAGCF